MKMRFCLFWLNILFCLPVLAQTQLHGFVTEQNSGKKPVANVLVKSFLANPIQCNSDGEFILTFQKAKPGSSVSIVAAKESWMVINDKELNLNLPENPKNSKLKIIMCRQSVYDERKMEYYNLSYKNITASYEKKKSLVDKKQAGWEKKIAALKSELDQLQNQLPDIAEEYSRTNLDDLNEKEQRAYQLYSEGKVEESRKLRESFQSRKNITKAQNEISKISKDRIAVNQTLDSIKEAKIKEVEFHTRSSKREALEARLNFDFAKAESILGFLAESDSTNFDNAYSYGKYLLRQKKFMPAEVWLDNAWRRAKTETEKFDVLERLANLYKWKDDLEKSEATYLKALEIIKIIPGDNEYTTAIMMHNMALLYRKMDQYSKAVDYFIQSYDIITKLAIANPKKYGIDFANIIKNTGSTYNLMNMLENSEKASLAALKLYEVYAQTYDPDCCGDNIAETQNNLGRLYMKRHNYPQAENAYLKAFEKYKERAALNPETYESDYADILDNLAELYGVKKNYTEAINKYSTALEIYQRLAKANPTVYENDMADILMNIGNSQFQSGNSAEAEKAYMNALEIFQRLAKANPSLYGYDLADTLAKMGTLFSERKDFDKSEQFYLQALDTYRKYVAANPDVYENSLADLLHNIGNLNSRKNDYAEALKYYNEAIEIYRGKAKANAGAVAPDLANSLLAVGSIAEFNDDYDTAEKSYLEVLDIYKKCAGTDSITFEPDVANTLDIVGSLYYYKMDEYEKSERAYAEALQIWQCLAKNNPTRFNSNEALTSLNIGNSYKSMQKYADAELHYNVALVILKQLATVKPQDYEGSLANTLYNLGTLYCKVEDWPAAEKNYTEACELYKHLSLSNPKSYQPEVARTLHNLSDVYVDMKNYDAARKTCNESLDIYKNLADQSPERYNAKISDAYIWLANIEGSLSWNLIKEKAFPEAEIAARKALISPREDNSGNYLVGVQWIYTNLALALLFQNKYSEAEKIYLSLKDKPYNNATYTTTFLADFAELEKAGITHPDVAKIRELLKK